MIRFLCALFIPLIRCQEVFTYPVAVPIERSSNIPHASNRDPLYAPSICPENHLLYPGKRQTDWTCDCAPGYVYYPEKDGCFAVYRQGPCPNNQYIYLEKGSIKPTCVENSCRKDGVVKYKGICHPLEEPGGPCKRANDTDPVTILTVVQSTLQLGCVSKPTRLAIVQAPSNCPPGSRRGHSGDCRTSAGDL